MRVFVLEPTMYSMFKASSFGSLVFLFSDETEHADWYMEEFIAQIKKRLEERSFDPEKDVIAVSGKMISVTIFVAAAVALYGDKLVMICFDHDESVRNFREVKLSCVLCEETGE